MRGRGRLRSTRRMRRDRARALVTRCAGALFYRINYLKKDSRTANILELRACQLWELSERHYFTKIQIKHSYNLSTRSYFAL